MASKGKLPNSYRPRQSDSTDVEEYFRASEFPAPAADKNDEGKAARLQIVRTDIATVSSRDLTSTDVTTPVVPSTDLTSRVLASTIVSSRVISARDIPSMDALSPIKLSAAKIRNLSQGRPAFQFDEAWVSLASGKTFHASKVQWVSIAQQSMTPGQERFYETIWRAKGDYYFQVETVDRNTKRFSAGYDVLSRVCRLASRNVRIIIPLLVQKHILLSHKDHESSKRKGTTYEIFSYEEILRRQRAAGLCYVVKSGPGIDFVLPLGWVSSPDVSSGDVSSGCETSMDVLTLDELPGDVSSQTLDVTSPVSLDVSSTLSLDETSTPLEKDTLHRQSTTVRKLLQILLPTFDNAAVEQLWSDCRREVPDVTPEEVAFLFERKLPESRSRSITNPIGFMLRAVARSCTPAAIGAMRQGREVPPENPIQHATEDLQGLLDDPATPAEIRQFIQQRMGKV